MSGHTENSTNSAKLAPMPMSALLANLMPLQNNLYSPDCSYSSGDDSMNGLGDTVKSVSLQEVKRDIFTSTPKVSHSVQKQASVKESLNVLSEKKISLYKKENYNDNFMASPLNINKDSQCKQSTISNVMSRVHPTSDIKQRSILMSQTNNNRIVSSTTNKTPENNKYLHSGNKIKISTPVIKSGIRKFTPTSLKRSNKKTPQKAKVETNERVRCLFPESEIKEDMRPPPNPVNPVHETPQSKKSLMPAPYVATPSYPQGIVGHRSKLIFKTCCIKGKKYLYIKKLGTGGSSEVYKVLEVSTSRELAVKCVDLAVDSDLVKGYINEVRLLKDLQDSDRVIKLYDYECDRSSQLLRLVLEVGDTDLSSFIRASGASLPPALVLHYWEEMLSAVHYIHSKDVIHADLKPANFLLVHGRLKLIDFGIASTISTDATSVVRSQAAGTYSYISPEALGGGQDATIKISFKSDVWSLGCILYSMVYGLTPFGHLSSLNAKLGAILNPNHHIDYPPVKHLPPLLIAALKWCLTYNARSRPSVEQLLNIPYMGCICSNMNQLPPALLTKLPATSHTCCSQRV